MSYLQDTLEKNEVIIHKGKLSNIVLYSGLFFLIPLCWTYIGPVIGILMLLVYFTTEVAVTSKRVIYKRGFISRKVDEIALSKVEGIQIDQGVGGRIFGYGTVKVRGTGAGIIKIPNIANPTDFRQAAQNAG